MNYAKSQPDMAILAVNTFVKVSFSVNKSFDMLVKLSVSVSQCSDT
jgi:hypothetical protein